LEPRTIFEPREFAIRAVNRRGFTDLARGVVSALIYVGDQIGNLVAVAKATERRPPDQT
jgi:hypothetical protein